MFLFDSFEFRSAEPVWFRLFRCVFAIILSIRIFLYLYDNFNDINKKSSLGQFAISGGSLETDITICTNSVIETLNVRHISLNDTIYYQSKSIPENSCNMVPLKNEITPPTPSSVPGWSIFWIDAITNNSTINNDMFSSYKYMLKDFSILPNTILKLTMNMSSSILDTQQPCFGNYPKPFYFYPRQASLIYVTPKIVLYDSFCEIELDVQSEQLPLSFDFNKIGLGISIKPLIRYEGIDAYEFADFLSDAGGFYGTIAGIFVLMFGDGKLGPWGLTQKYILSRLSFTQRLAKEYAAAGGIPLVGEVKKRPKKLDEPSESLEARVQILETLLKDYYLDDYHLNEVKEFMDQYNRMWKDLEKTEKTNENFS